MLNGMHSPITYKVLIRHGYEKNSKLKLIGWLHVKESTRKQHVL